MASTESTLDSAAAPAAATSAPVSAPAHAPARLGFVGVGPIGKPRLRSILAAGAGEAGAIWESREVHAEEARVIAPGVRITGSFAEMLDLGLDGIVIATPSAVHAEQATAALERGIAVFCQQPLGIDAEQTRAVIDTARSTNTLLGVDLSYRHAEAMRVVRSTVQAGELGDIYAVDAEFLDGNGPDNAWAHDARVSGGGCVMELGIQTLDLALWTLGFPRVTDVTSRLYARGERISGKPVHAVDDYATAMLDLDTGVVVNLACAWQLPVGRESLIRVTFYGTEGGATFRNVHGSYHDFTAELFRGTHSHVLASPPDDWRGRAAVEWARSLSRGQRYDPWIEGVADVAAAVDRVLRR